MNPVRYAVVLFSVGLGAVLSIVAPVVLSLVVVPTEWKSGFELFRTNALSPIISSAYPIPRFVLSELPNEAWLLLTVVQLLLLTRRITLWRASHRLVLPPHLGRVTSWLLSFGLGCWVVGIAIFLLPFLWPNDPNYGGAVIFFLVITPVVWLPAMVLLGPLFFILELLSLRAEGLFPHSNGGVQPTPTNGRG